MHFLLPACSVVALIAGLGLGLPAARAQPVIAEHPRNQQISNNSTVVFSVTAPAATAFQWRKNGTPLAGATNASHVIFGATRDDVADYSVVASNAGGNTPSIAASLSIAVGFDFGRLINLSILTDLTADAPNFILGTVVGGAGVQGTKPLLIRAVGPSLNQLIGTGALADSRVDLFAGSAVVAANDDWRGTPELVEVFNQVGAFALTGPDSKDAALSTSLAVGSYTVLVSGAPGATGRVIAEFYDATPAIFFRAPTPRLINVSVRKQIDTGTALTAGFVIAGSTAKTVLVRAIGPGLGVFGVPGVMADPQLELFGGSVSIARNDNWGGDAQLTAAGTRVGAFAIANPRSADAMLLITLPPGNYSAEVRGASGGGAALVEVYEVP